jgi:hypothetical protein
MWLRVSVPEQSDSSALFEELGIPHEEEIEKNEIFLNMKKVLAIATQVGLEDEGCWLCTMGEQALPIMARFDDVLERIEEMQMNALERKIEAPNFACFNSMLPKQVLTEEDEEDPIIPALPREQGEEELIEHRVLLNLDEVFHISEKSSLPHMISVGYGEPSLQYELLPESYEKALLLLGLSQADKLPEEDSDS